MKRIVWPLYPLADSDPLPYRHREIATPGTAGEQMTRTSPRVNASGRPTIPWRKSEFYAPTDNEIAFMAERYPTPTAEIPNWQKARLDLLLADPLLLSNPAAAEKWPSQIVVKRLREIAGGGKDDEVTIADAVNKLGNKRESSLRRAVRAGKLKSVKLDGTEFLKMSDVHEWNKTVPPRGRPPKTQRHK